MLYDKLHFTWQQFSELSALEVYEILALRSAVFIVEQHAFCHDPDGKDIFALHLMGMKNNHLVAYLRLFPPTETNNDLVFGRVLTATSARTKGFGKQLIQTLITYCDIHYPDTPIQCSAQFYLKKFYENFGFIAYGDIYDDAGIPHISMRRG